MTSVSYVSPGSQSTWAVKVVLAPAGTPSSTFVTVSSPRSLWLVTVTPTGVGPSVTSTCDGLTLDEFVPGRRIGLRHRAARSGRDRAGGCRDARRHRQRLVVGGIRTAVDHHGGGGAGPDRRSHHRLGDLDGADRAGVLDHPVADSHTSIGARTPASGVT